MKYSLLALLAVMGLASCSNDYEYTPAGAESGNKVFFPAELLSKSSYNLDLNATSFDIQIERTDTVGELTVALENRQNVNSTTQLTVPESVTFANGEKTATITIAYDPTTIEFDDVNRDTLIIASSELLSEYSASEYRFSVSIAEPWTPWIATEADWAKAGGQGNFPLGTVGTGTYTYSIFFSGDDIGLPVSFRQNKVDTKIGQFKIEEWGYGVDFVFDAEWDAERNYWRIVVPTTYIGYDHATYGPVYAGDYIGYYDFAGKGELTWETLERNGLESYYDPATGRFNLYLLYYVPEGVFGEDVEIFQVDGFYVPNYSAGASFAGILKGADEKNYAVVDFTLGRDVAVAKYVMTDASKSEGDVANAIVSGEIETVEIGQSDRKYIDLADDGKYRVTVVTFDAEGNAQESASTVFEFEAGGSSWVSLGMGLYTEDFMTTFFQIESQTYEVEILEKSTKPGLYRLKNPYGAAFPYNEEGDWDDSMDYYLEIDATVPNNVVIEAQEMGLDWGYGMLSVWSLANAKGEGYGTLKDGVITFPEGSLLVSMAGYQNGGFYIANNNGAFKVVLPDAATGMKAYKAPVKKHVSRSNVKDAKKFVLKTVNSDAKPYAKVRNF